MNQLPNVIIAGAPKSGTSTLFRWLADHPEVAGSREKETYFFVDPGTHMYRADRHVASSPMSAYTALFEEKAAATVTMEATPAYLYAKTALEHVPDLPTRPKVLFVLREPAAQIHSLYEYFRSNWNWIDADMDFAGFLDAVRAGTHDFRGNDLAINALAYGRYADYLDQWRGRLGEDRMIVYGFEALLRDEGAFIKTVARDIGIDPGFYDSYDFPRENETYQPRSRAIQNLNIAVRNLIPDGAARNAIRTAYRRLNTRKPDPKSTHTARLMDDLRHEFREANERLARDYGIDVSAWSPEMV